MIVQPTILRGTDQEGVTVILSIGVRYRTVRPVEFVCPRCGLDRTGSELVPGRWARVFGVSVLPLGEHEPVIQCDDCGHESDLGVLDVPTTQQLVGILEHATVAALVTAVRTSDLRRIDNVLASAHRALLDVGYEPGQIDLDEAVATLSEVEARDRLRRLGSELTTHGKQGFLHRVAAVAMAGTSLEPAARDALVRMGCDLGMAAPHINGVLAVANTRVDA